MSKNQFKLISFAEINRLRDERGELVLSQGDKQWLRSELKQIAYVLDLTKQEIVSLAFVLAENSATKPGGYPDDDELQEEYAKGEANVEPLKEKDSEKPKVAKNEDETPMPEDSQKPMSNNVEDEFVENVVKEDTVKNPAKKKAVAKKKSTKKTTKNDK